MSIVVKFIRHCWIGLIAVSLLTALSYFLFRWPSDDTPATVGDHAATPSLLVDDFGLGKSADGQLLLKYTVQCALPDGDAIDARQDGARVALGGALGLAPDWKTHPLSATDRRWLSACILARINAFGETVQLSLRGDHPALRKAVSEAERRDYTFQEGAFYGDLFADPPAMYVCRGVGGVPAAPTRALRVCSETPAESAENISRCGMTVAGDCATVCRNDPGQAGVFASCDGGGQSYRQVATVFLANPSAPGAAAAVPAQATGNAGATASDATASAIQSSGPAPGMF